MLIPQPAAVHELYIDRQYSDQQGLAQKLS